MEYYTGQPLNMHVLDFHQTNIILHFRPIAFVLQEIRLNTESKVGFIAINCFSSPVFLFLNNLSLLEFRLN